MASESRIVANGFALLSGAGAVSPIRMEQTMAPLFLDFDQRRKIEEVGEAEIDLEANHRELVEIEKAIAAAKEKHNDFLKELGLSPLP